MKCSQRQIQGDLLEVSRNVATLLKIAESGVSWAGGSTGDVGGSSRGNGGWSRNAAKGSGARASTRLCTPRGISSLTPLPQAR